MNERAIKFQDDGLWACASVPCLPGWVTGVHSDESPEYERQRMRFDRGDVHAVGLSNPPVPPRRRGIEK